MRIIKILSLLVGGGFALFLLTAQVQAITATSSALAAAGTGAGTTASSSASPSAQQATDNLVQRVQAIYKTRTGEVKSAVDDLTQKKRGFVGTVARVIEKTVTVQKVSGDTEGLTIDPTQVTILKDGKKATLDDIAVGDWVIALGYTDGQNFTLRRLIVSTTTILPKTYDTIIANAAATTKTQLSLVNKNGGDPLVYLLNRNTKYVDAADAALKVTDLKKDSQYLVVSYSDSTGNIAVLVKNLGQ